MRSRIPRSRVTHDRWLVSYADFITLLFAFFVVLFASAKADAKKQQEVSHAIDAAFRSLGLFPDAARHAAKETVVASGVEKPAYAMNIIMGEDVLSPAKARDDLEAVRRNLQQRLSNQIAQHTVSIKAGKDGLVISLREAGFFDSGSATPRPGTLDTLRQVGAALAATPFDLRVEGHTDNVPIHSAEFDSNWELSAARATRIARTFLDLGLIAPERISAAGYAEFHPVANNETSEGRAENRRVDLVILPRTRIDLSATTPTDSTGKWRKITDSSDESKQP